MERRRRLARGLSGGNPARAGRWLGRLRRHRARLARWHDHGTRLALTALDHPVVVVVLELFPGELLPGHPDSTAI